MLITFEELISGYKRSLRLLKAVDKKSYKQLLSFFKSMKKKDLKFFFATLKQDLETKTNKMMGTYSLHCQVANCDDAFISYDNNYNLVIRHNVNAYLSDKWILFRISPLVKNSTLNEAVFFEKDNTCKMIFDNYRYRYTLCKNGSKGVVKISRAEKEIKAKNVKKDKEVKKQELDKYCRV